MAETASKSSPLTKFSLKAIIIVHCFDVFPVGTYQKFQGQAKISKVWPMFLEYLSVAYKYNKFSNEV